MKPPWQQYPTYERYTIGWRMGAGEDYLHSWYAHVKALPDDYESRIAYLRDHRPAPINWADQVLAVLEPNADTDQEYGCSPREVERLLELNLIGHDVAYHTWRQQQPALVMPWQWNGNSETPEKAMRWRTREFWFFSRQLQEFRGEIRIDDVPESWAAIERPLREGKLGELNPALGLLTFAQMLCAHEIRAPWQLGLSRSDFANSFEENMGFTDAFRLWMMCAFDDDRLLREMLATSGIPGEWTGWIDQEASYG